MKHYPYKYVEYYNGERELYDLSSDPYELESQHDSADPALVGELESRLEALKECAGQSCREAEDAPQRRTASGAWVRARKGARELLLAPGISGNVPRDARRVAQTAIFVLNRVSSW